MEYRQLGNSGLKVPVLSLETAAFGGGTEFFKTWGDTDVKEASRLIDPETSRLHATSEQGPQVADEKLYDVVDFLDEIAQETSKTVTQVALNWLLQRPTVANVIIGARNEE